MNIKRTPDERFDGLSDFPFEPHYVEISDGVEGSNGRLRVHYVDEGAATGGAGTILLLHGEPSWSYLYRKMIPPLVAAGHRVVAPDLVGFGRTDKPAEQADYSYHRLIDWTTAVIELLDLQEITLFGQDWGGLIGLRIAIANEDRFSRLVIANTGLPIGTEMPEAFYKWRHFSQKVSKFQVGRVINGGTVNQLSRDVIAAYNAPFPDESYKAGARVLPSLVPITEDDPESAKNRLAWRKLMKWKKPLLTTFSDSDPITAGGDRPFQRLVPGAKGQAHVTIADAGHFLQEDSGEELAEVISEFVAKA